MSGLSEAITSLQSATLEWIQRFAPYGVIATDRELRVQTWNNWMAQHSGCEAKSVQGRKLTEIYPDLEKRRLSGRLDRALQGEVSVVSTALHGWLIPLPSLVREATFPFMKQTARIAPLTVESQIHGLLIVIEDVTQREWQAEILRRQHAREEVLAWALAQLMEAEEASGVVREVFCKVAEHLDFDSYLMHLRNPVTGFFELSASGGIPPEKEDLVRSVPPDSIPWLEARERQAVVREQVGTSTDPMLNRGRELGFSAYVVLPLVVGANLLGLFTFATRTRDKVAANEVDLLTTIAQYLSISLNREKADRELRAAQAKLNGHAQELEKTVADRTASLKQTIAELQAFSYTIAHDLRAPIRAVQGYSEVLLDDYSENLPSDGAAILHRLRNASVQMDNLTRDLLEFSKVSRQDLTLTSVDLGEVVTESVLLGGARVSAATKVEHPLHSVVANRTLVGQCVANLLHNAVKFSKPGMAPTVRIWSEKAEKMAPARGGVSHFSPARYSASESNPAQSTRVRLWFEDNGIGISSESQQKVFGIFERGDRAGEYEGTGIGLAIVARAMERMGGSCGVESTLDQGSRFWLEFPAA